MANITHTYSNTTKSYEITEFDKTKEAYKEWLKNNIHSDVVIDSDEVYSTIYKERTTLRRELDNLKGDKKIINSIILGTFNNQCTEIIAMLEEEDEKITSNLETYKPKVPTYELKVRTKDKALYEKLKNYAIKLGLLEKEN